VDIGGVPLGHILGVTSPWALLSLTFYLIITGKIVPRSTLNDVINDRNAWRTTSETCMETQREQSEQLNNMLDALRVLNDRLQDPRFRGW